MNVADFIGLSRNIGQRFTLIGVLPTGVLELFVLALLWSGTPGEAPDPSSILTHARTLDAWSGALLLLVLLVIAVLLQPFQLGLVRVLEGYWGAGPLAAKVAAVGRRRHAKRVDMIERQLNEPLETPEAARTRHQLLLKCQKLYPQDRSLLLPTSLGNALRAGEARAGGAYGLDAVVVWPRLYPILSDTTRGLVDDQRDQLDVNARFCAVFLTAAVIAAGLLSQYGWWLLVPAGCVVLARVSYSASIAAALAYGEGMRIAIDLQRFDMLRALHLPLPADRGTELATNSQLTAFLRDDNGTDLVYSHDGAGVAPADGYGVLLPQEARPDARPPASSHTLATVAHQENTGTIGRPR